MEPVQPSGFRRRSAAFIVDLVVGIQLGLIATAVTGLVIPLDTPSAMAAFALAGLIAVGYVAFAPLLNTGSLGKHALGIAVIDEATGAQAGILQCLLRGLTIGLWPIEAGILMFSKGKRRLGDRLAGTLVVPQPGEVRPWYARLGIAAASIGALYVVNMSVMGVAAARTGIFNAAHAYVASGLEKGMGEAEFGKPIVLASSPRQIDVLNDTGLVVMAISGPRKSSFINVWLARTPEGWKYRDARVTETAGRGYSFKYVSLGGLQPKP